MGQQVVAAGVLMSQLKATVGGTFYIFHYQNAVMHKQESKPDSPSLFQSLFEADLNFLAERVQMLRGICTAFQYQSPWMRGVQTTPMFPPNEQRALRGRKSSSNGGEERMKR